MRLTFKRKNFLKSLLFFLLFVIMSTFLVFFSIRNEELKKTNSSISQLKKVDPKTEIIGKCFQQIFEADNNFKLYSLSYDSLHYARYRGHIDSLILNLDTLKSCFEAESEEELFVTNAGISLNQKIDISASFVNLKRITDSLLYTAVAIDSFSIQSKNPNNFRIKSFDPSKLKSMIDTMNIFTTTFKLKKGILEKIKTFIAGGTEELITHQQLAIKSKDSLATNERDATSQFDFTDVIAGKTDNYYQKQLRSQKYNREKLASKERMLVLITNELMTNLNSILNALNDQIEQTDQAVKNNALTILSNSTKKLNKVSLISLFLVVLIVIGIILVLRQMSRSESLKRENLISHLELSEEKYRNLIESATDSIFIIKKGNIEYVNQVLIQLSGYKEMEIIGKPFINFVSANDRQRIAEFHQKRLKGETAPLSYESFAVLKNGEEIPVEVTISVFNYFGELAELVFLRDIRGRKEAEIKIMESKISFENLFENSPVSIWEEDITEVMQKIEQLKQTGIQNFEAYFEQHPEEIIKFLELIKVLRINKETLSLYQANNKEELFVNINNTFLPESFDVFKSELISLANGETKVEAKTRVKTLQGKILDVIVRMFTLIVENRQIAYVTTIDVSKLSAAEAEIRKLNEELENRVKERTAQLEAVNFDLESFAYSVSHDLRAPIRHIDAFTKIIDQSIPDQTPELERYFKRVYESSAKMSKMIDDLLNFSRLGRKSLNKTEIDLNALINQVISLFATDINNRTIEWKIEKLPVIQGDISLLNLVFENLISNALKFTSKNEKTIIEIGKCNKSDKCSFYIKDNGVGFDMKYADKLFGVFQRLHNQDDFEGTGIGLANIKQIIQKHGGSITAHAELNKGATFFINL
ncbi:MAG: PAS domain S-box protein [Prolixibacteraceae bacterium]